MTTWMTLEGEHLRWDKIRETPTSFSAEAQRIANGVPMHESLLRSYHVLDEVKDMLDRGDSPQTVREFVRWAEARRGRDEVEDALRGLDGPISWIAENHEAALEEMPTELMEAIKQAARVLAR